MTLEVLAEIEARCAAATPGPWGTMDGAPWNVLDASGCRILWVNRDDYRSESGKQDERDAAFLAHARQDVEELIAEVRSMDAMARVLRAELEAADAEKDRLMLVCEDKEHHLAGYREAAAADRAEIERLRAEVLRWRREVENAPLFPGTTGMRKG